MSNLACCCPSEVPGSGLPVSGVPVLKDEDAERLLGDLFERQREFRNTVAANLSQQKVQVVEQTMTTKIEDLVQQIQRMTNVFNQHFERLEAERTQWQATIQEIVSGLDAQWKIMQDFNEITNQDISKAQASSDEENEVLKMCEAVHKFTQDMSAEQQAGFEKLEGYTARMHETMASSLPAS